MSSSATFATSPLFESDVQSLERLHQGKVRDIYAVDDEHLLIVATDRMSAFDVVLPDPIPGKGRVLTGISRFWFERTTHITPNHFVSARGPKLEELVTDQEQRAQLAGRAMVVRRLKPLPIEAVVRGYLLGSGWKDYQRTGTVCGIALPPGLVLAGQLPEPIFTPATKAAVGTHDENIDYGRVVEQLGVKLAAQVRDTAISLYRYAADHARARGIIIADTKFEFGLDDGGGLVLIDEALTPDSSRFWPVETYRPGISPPSFDKQIIRDYLQTLDWNKQPPAPRLPAEIIRRTSEKYEQALKLLTR